MWSSLLADISGMMSALMPDPLPIDTSRLHIRSLTAADADGLHRVFGDPQAMRYVGSSGNARTRAQTADSVAQYMAAEREHGFGLWAADRRSDGRMIGLCGLTLVEGTGPEVEVVYVLERPAWGRGYATEMARACLESGFGAFGLDRIIALAYPLNAASIQVMRKAGMRPAGTMHAHGHELVCYEAVPADLA
jgi:RimJ/RimL family protein N-acetyltransferase